MRCWRVLYKPDNTAFMVWAGMRRDALKKARARNVLELENSEGESASDYMVDEFTPDTNGTGILAFYDVYSVNPRDV